MYLLVLVPDCVSWFVAKMLFVSLCMIIYTVFAWGVSIHWTGILDWTTGLDYWTGIFLVFAHSVVKIY